MAMNGPCLGAFAVKRGHRMQCESSLAFKHDIQAGASASQFRVKELCAEVLLKELGTDESIQQARKVKTCDAQKSVSH